jgi:LmbE family N-acetylglucosaminyl deacetylase
VLSEIEPFTYDDSHEAKQLDVSSLGNICIIAPHPDDESLGCGGLIALARKASVRVHVVAASDGSRSHPNSLEFPPERIRTIRRYEFIAATETLGVPASELSFLPYLDCEIPNRTNIGFAALVDALSGCMERCDANTVLVPYFRDPHRDHQAVHAAAYAARTGKFSHVGILEYPIWVSANSATGADPIRAEQLWKLDIRSVLPDKKAAVRCHVSQTSDLIEDDRSGFRLDANMLAKFEQNTEYYFEVASSCNR